MPEPGPPRTAREGPDCRPGCRRCADLQCRGPEVAGQKFRRHHRFQDRSGADQVRWCDPAGYPELRRLQAERDRRETLLQAEGHKQAIITRAEGDKQAAILQAEGERDARIARAEGEAKEIFLKKKAEADGLAELNKAGIRPEVLELKRFESLERVANGQAAKIIVPTDAVEMTKKDVIFAETAGLGDFTKPAKRKVDPAKVDPCCERFDKKE